MSLGKEIPIPLLISAAVSSLSYFPQLLPREFLMGLGFLQQMNGACAFVNDLNYDHSDCKTFFKVPLKDSKEGIKGGLMAGESERGVARIFETSL